MNELFELVFLNYLLSKLYLQIRDTTRSKEVIFWNKVFFNWSYNELIKIWMKLHELLECVFRNYVSDWNHIRNWDTGMVFRQYECECDSSYWGMLSWSWSRLGTHIRNCQVWWVENSETNGRISEVALIIPILKYNLRCKIQSLMKS